MSCILLFVYTAVCQRYRSIYTVYSAVHGKLICNDQILPASKKGLRSYRVQAGDEPHGLASLLIQFYLPQPCLGVGGGDVPRFIIPLLLQMCIFSPLKLCIWLRWSWNKRGNECPPSPWILSESLVSISGSPGEQTWEVGIMFTILPAPPPSSPSPFPSPLPPGLGQPIIMQPSLSGTL